MKILKTYPHFTDVELKEKMNSQTKVRAFQDWQIIYSVQTNYGKTAEEFAKILGVSKQKILHVVQQYNKYGEAWRRYDNWGGRREARCNMTLEEEKAILSSLESDALNGQVLIYKQVKKIVEEKLRREVSDDYIWDMFKRHGWKKKVPRPSHPKANREEQEEYKKNFKRTWYPNH
jgi:transposase